MIEPHHPKGVSGRPPIGLERMAAALCQPTRSRKASAQRLVGSPRL